VNEKITARVGYIILVTWLALLAGNIFQYIRGAGRSGQLHQQYRELERTAEERIGDLERGLQYAGGTLGGIGEAIGAIKGITETNVGSIQGARTTILRLREQVKVVEDLVNQWHDAGIDWDNGWHTGPDGEVKE
jgi:hypothetical protein